MLLKRTVLAPLIHFSSQVKSSQIGILKVTPLSKAAKTALENPTAAVYFGPLTLGNASHALRLSHRTAPPLRQHDQAILDAQDVVAALRIHKSGSVAMPTVLETGRGSDGHIWTFGTKMLHLQPDNDFALNPYVLTRNDCIGVQKIFKALKAHRSNGKLKGLEVAISRFNLAYGRFHVEDKMIDLTIALESTLLHGISEELSFRLALLGAALLASKRDAQSVRDLLKLVYVVRSGIVHNGLTISELKKRSDVKRLWNRVGLGSPHDLFLATEQLVREVITEYLNLLAAFQSLTEINENIDKTIIEHL